MRWGSCWLFRSSKFKLVSNFNITDQSAAIPAAKDAFCTPWVFDSPVVGSA